MYYISFESKFMYHGSHHFQSNASAKNLFIQNINHTNALIVQSHATVYKCTQRSHSQITKLLYYILKYIAARHAMNEYTILTWCEVL